MKFSLSSFFILLISLLFIPTNTVNANIEGQNAEILPQKENLAEQFQAFENKVLDRLMTKRVEQALTKVKQFFKIHLGEKELLRILLVVVLVLLLIGLIGAILNSLPLIRSLLIIVVTVLLILYIIRQFT
jgi:hypothetical protein